MALPPDCRGGGGVYSPYTNNFTATNQKAKQQHDDSIQDCTYFRVHLMGSRGLRNPG